MATKTLTQANHDETVKDGIVLIDFWAAWCGPCRQFGPVFEKVSEENPDATFVKVDTEDQQELAQQYGVTSIPTLVIYRDGIPIYGQPGAMRETALKDLLTQVRDIPQDTIDTARSEYVEKLKETGRQVPAHLS